MQEDKGNCKKHGEFILTEGCPQCLAETRAEEAEDAEVNSEANIAKRIKEAAAKVESKPSIVKVRCYSDTTGEFSSREYAYYSEDKLSVGDIVVVPVRDTTGKAKVSAVDVPRIEIARFEDKVKTIPSGSIIIEEEETGRAEELRNISETTTKMEKAFKKLEQIEANQSTVLVKIKPEADIQVMAFYNEALKAKEYAEARVIVTVDDLKPAAVDLSLIAKLKKAIEEKRKEYVKPLQDHVKTINDAFKTLMEPIETADTVTRNKIIAFQLKQKVIREEQERINALRLEAAQKEMELKGELTESVNLVEVALGPVKRVSTNMGSTGMVDHWKYEVIDFIALPNEYKVADTAMLNSIAKKHHDQKQIPGVRFYNEPIITVRAR